MSCTCGDATCNCLFVCCCQRNLCSCDLCAVVRETCCSICGLPFDTEGQDVCKCFLESCPDTSQATAGQQMHHVGKKKLNPIPSIATEESISSLNATQSEVKIDRDRTFSSQKVPGRPFYRNEGFNFQLPHMPMWYAPRPVFNLLPIGFLDHSRFSQYSFPQIVRSSECSLTINRPPTPDVTPSEKHAYIQNWLEHSNAGAGHDQEEDAPCSSATTELTRNIVTPGRKIKSRFPLSRNNASEGGLEKISSMDGDCIPRKKAGDNRTLALKVEEKNAILVEEVENTRLIKSLSSTKQGDDIEKETSHVDLETTIYKQGPPQIPHDSKPKQK